MASKKGFAVAALAGLALLLFAGGASAALPDDLPPPPDPDPIPPPPPGEDPPPPPPANLCNFVGCPGFTPAAGAQWTERYVGLRLQQLGYAINPAAGDFSLVSAYSRGIVRQFQRDYNRARTGFSPVPPALATDGLAGNRTIAAIERATAVSLQRSQSWLVIVGLSPP